MGVSTITIGTKTVIVVDVSNKDSDQTAEIKACLKQGSALVATKPEKSVYIITNVANVKFNSDISTAFKEYAAANTKYIKESVIVGLGGMQTIVFQAIKAMTKREFHLSATMDEARAYLTSLK
jgi:predicted SPOUT superfamily RNA methylase MTH1